MATFNIGSQAGFMTIQSGESGAEQLYPKANHFIMRNRLFIGNGRNKHYQIDLENDELFIEGKKYGLSEIDQINTALNHCHTQKAF